MGVGQCSRTGDKSETMGWRQRDTAAPHERAARSEEQQQRESEEVELNVGVLECLSIRDGFVGGGTE